jgi:DNA invertase Pin-like site-specific DNA recombinase
VRVARGRQPRMGLVPETPARNLGASGTRDDRLWAGPGRLEAMSTVVGYARVSTREQNPDAQEAALRSAGAGRVFVDHGESSRRTNRPAWVSCMDYLRAGDTLLVYRLDRVAGTTASVIQIISELGERGINIRSLTEPDIDTTTPMGRALFGIVAVFAQLRVDTIRQNTLDGLAHARTQGRVGGRPTVMTPGKIDAAVRLRAAGSSTAAIAKALGVGRATVSRALLAHDDGPARSTEVSTAEPR